MGSVRSLIGMMIDGCGELWEVATGRVIDVVVTDMMTGLVLVADGVTNKVNDVMMNNKVW